MLQALWSVEALTTDGPVAIGVLIFHLRRVFGDYFQSGRLFGGDRECHYTGRYEIENMVLSARMEVFPYGNAPHPVFGSGNRFRIDFGGCLDDDVERDVIIFAARKYDDDIAFEIRLTKRAPLQ